MTKSMAIVSAVFMYRIVVDTLEHGPVHITCLRKHRSLYADDLVHQSAGTEIEPVNEMRLVEVIQCCVITTVQRRYIKHVSSRSSRRRSFASM
jgi:hypothetical protein